MAQVVPSTDIISHDDALDLMRITLMVYAYGKQIKFDENDKRTIETFVSQLKENGRLDSLGLSDVYKCALIEMASNALSGRVCAFYSDKETDVQVGVTVNPAEKRICIVFRGSESIKDWLYDFKITKHHLKDGVMVHRGFYAQLNKNGVYQRLLAKVKRLLGEHPGFSIYITGHSLGGALATLCGFMMSYELENKITVVSFASPRVGNAAWKKAFDQKSNIAHYRVTNGRDVITAFPMFKYYHVGITIRLFERSFKIFMDYKRFHWYDFTFFQCWRASDHMSELYYERLKINKW
jgi:hypothetical protein